MPSALEILQAGQRYLASRLNFHGDDHHPMGSAGELGAELGATAIPSV